MVRQTELLKLTAANFDRVLDTTNLLVIDFWAPWCEPCKNFEQVCVELSAQMPSVCFARVNIDEEVVFAEEFAIRSVPFVLILKNRAIVHAESGVIEKDNLSSLISLASTHDVAEKV
jgi:thioredoxin 1